jgi:hypothetical protein
MKSFHPGAKREWIWIISQHCIFLLSNFSLLSANNGVFKKQHTKVYQDMSQPLASYIINSYKPQAAQGSVVGYIRALQSGCKFIEGFVYF